MFNKTILLGNLTNQPEVKYTTSGKAVTNFGLAVNRKYKQGDEMKEEVLFIGVVVWGKQGESCGQYLDKGSQVLVEGRLQEDRWETDDGQKRSKIKLVGENVKFLSKLNVPKSDVDKSTPEDIEPF